MNADIKNIEGRLNFYDLQSDLTAPFKDIAKAVEKHAPAALEAFYRKASATPAASAHFASQQMMNQASAKQLNHWRQLFAGPIDG